MLQSTWLQKVGHDWATEQQEQSTRLVFYWIIGRNYGWRLLRVAWTARRSNQSTLKEIGPGISLQGMMLMLKLQYFGHLMWRVDSLEKTLMLEKIEGKRRGWQRRDGWMASPTRLTRVWTSSGSWWWTGRPGMLWFMGLQRVGHNWATELSWNEIWLFMTLTIFTDSFN